MKKNKGYTLVEMLVVIAIMAILSGLAAVSIGLIYKAKVRDGIQSFNSQLSNTWLRTKSTSSKGMMYAEMEWEDKGFTYTVIDKSSGTATTKDSAMINKWTRTMDWQTSKISYVPSDSSQLKSGYGDTNKKWYIEFDKSTGAVTYGAGEYIFYMADGSVAGRIYLDKTTGNHFSVDYDGSASNGSQYYINKGTIQSTTSK